MIKTQREKFELWASQYDYDLTWSDLIDNYNFSVTRILFDVWQAAIESVVVELPPVFDAAAHDATYYEYAYSQAGVHDALDKEGIRYEQS